MYYVLCCPRLVNEKGEAQLEIHNCFRIGNIRSWRGGKPLKDVNSIPSPIEITFDPFRGYTGPPEEYRDIGIPLMSVRLASALLESGVDNIQFFDIDQKNSATGQIYEYRAFNIVGLVSAADLEQSDWSSYDNKPIADVSFRKLVLEESKIPNLLLFRLAENINAVMIHENVHTHILSKNIDTLDFVNPDEWVHL